MDGAKEDLVDMFIVHTVEEIQVRCLCDHLILGSYRAHKLNSSLSHRGVTRIFDVES